MAGAAVGVLAVGVPDGVAPGVALALAVAVTVPDGVPEGAALGVVVTPGVPAAGVIVSLAGCVPTGTDVATAVAAGSVTGERKGKGMTCGAASAIVPRSSARIGAQLPLCAATEADLPPP
ncbi:MAG: hypothetical protein M3Z19_11365, partial [Chloroflexota bacterium]|nr:hypothetical protein [Chloroflexota bacterium]